MPEGRTEADAEKARIIAGKGGAHIEPREQSNAKAFLPRPEDCETLEQLEEHVRQYHLSWVKAGRALARIYDDQFYLASSSTFEGYVERKCTMSARHAWALIRAAKIAKVVRKVPHCLSLAAALKLGRVTTDLQSKLLLAVINETGTRSPTAKQVAEAAAKWSTKVPRKTKKKVKPRQVRYRGLAGGEVRLILKPGIDERALLLEALARLDASEAA